MRRITIAFALCTTVFWLSGCKKKIACDPADSDAVCKGFQECLRSDTSTEVCRQAEKDANNMDKGASHQPPTH
jgi:uncharacterized protein YgiB involved in biofilm formation